MQKYDIYHIIRNKNVKKPQTILKVLSALLFFKVSLYFCFTISGISMQKYNISRSNYFYAIGLSYKKADADIRGRFSLDEESKLSLINQARENDIESIILNYQIKFPSNLYNCFVIIPEALLKNFKR